METNYPLKLWIYTFCYNEEKILPYIIEYWKQYATKVIVYDNGSTDNSLKILSQYSWIEVREFDTENTFDPEKISQYKSFCYADAIGKADYIMVCDIDEVLLPTENLFPELILAKKDNVQLFQTKYYEIINNELNPKYDFLIHTIDGYYAYPNTNIHKAIIFDPLIKISFGPNSLSYTTDIDYKTNSIITLHLKLFNASIFVERQKHLISRLKTNYKFSSDSLYYGTDKNIGTRMSYFKLLVPYKYRFNKNENYITITDNIYTANNQNIQFKDMAWLPTQINHNSENTNKECIFGIPVYKSALSVTEKASLNQLCKIIGNEYELCLICPADMTLNEYFEIADKHNIKLSTLFCAKQYFRGTKTYSFMCETADFYKCFNEYKYLFIYQLDGWIFENKVKEYLNLNVDYIGSPWDINTFHFQIETVGNGGVSLRRVEKFINICNSLTASDYLKDYVDREDLFFCKTMVLKSALKKPSVKQACGFSISGTGMQSYFMRKYNDGKLPMCLHAWHKDLKYWTKYIDLTEFNETAKEPIKIPVPQKNDYKTRLELIKMQLNNTNKPLNIQPKKVENKKEIKQNTTMSSGYSNFLASYYGIKPKKQEIKWNGYSTTQPAKSTVPAKKVEEKKVEVKQEIIQKVNNINQHINILIVHYNTPYLTECLIKSINKFVGYNCTIYIFDNSDKEPFTYRQSNIKIFDNTKGQIIDFKEEFKKYPESKNNPSAKQGFASASHCLSIDKCFDLINDNFILLDSDILLKKNILELYNNNYIFCGEIGKQLLSHGKKSKERLIPYICYINVKKCKELNIRYFNGEHMLGICDVKTDNNLYETGAWFLEQCKKYEHKIISYKQYIEHYGNASFEIKNIKANINTWLNKNNQYWNMNNKVIYTCITGNYEKIVDPSYVQKDFDYICFTDNMNQTSKVWKFIPIPEELTELTKVKQQRTIKICPHLYLPQYNESIWVDGSVDILGDMNDFIKNYCCDKNKSVFIRKHPVRNCIYKESVACSYGKDTWANMKPQMDKYKNEHFPENYGLVESNMIYRRHNDPYCINLMNKWAAEVKNYSHRDQLSFNYALWKIGDDSFQYLDTKLINSKYFKWYNQHNRK